MKKTKKKSARRVRAGKPPQYNSPDEFQAKIDSYFKRGITMRTILVGPPNNRKIKKIPVPTITDLVLHCGFCNRQSFYDYEKIPEYSYTIKRARSRIESVYESLLQTSTPVGAIFALKNFDWKDKQEIEHLLPESTIEKFAALSVTQLLEKANAIIIGKPAS